MLVSILAFVRTHCMPRNAKIIQSRSRSLNPIKPFRKENGSFDVIDSGGSPSLKEVEGRIFKSEIKILDAIEKKLDFISRRIDDIMMHL